MSDFIEFFWLNTFYIQLKFNMIFWLFLNILIVRIKCSCDGLNETECAENPNCEYIYDVDWTVSMYKCVNIPCEAHCSTCSKDNSTRCYSCKDGFYLDKNVESLTYEKCVRDLKNCDVNCETCDMHGSCTKCKLGYGKAKNNKCQKCKTEHCYDCSHDYETCTECEVLYGYDNNVLSDTYQECIKCNADHCMGCHSSDVCTECLDYFGLDNDEDSKTYGQCISCKVKNCYDCQDDAEECLLCKSGYGVDDDEKSPTYKQCIQCANQNCIDCGFNSEYCFECEEDYILNNNKCIERKYTENCEEYGTQLNTCIRCKHGYGLDKHKYDYPVCVKCGHEDFKVDLCFNAEHLYEGSCICLECIDGYYVGSLNENNVGKWGKCFQCDISNCKKCETHAKYCDECIDGFGLDISPNTKNYGQCIPCQKANCKSCSSHFTRCDTCKDGFKLNDDGSCVQGSNDDNNDPDNPNNKPNDDENKKENNDGKMSKTTLIIIVVVVVVVVVALIVFLTVFFVLRKKRKDLENSSNEGNVIS